MENCSPELSGSIKSLMPTLNTIDDFRHNVLSCKCLDTHNSAEKRMEFSFGLPWRQMYVSQDKPPIDLQIHICKYLETIKDSRPCVGKAPRNANVGKVYNLLDDPKKLGVKGIAK